MNHSKGVPSNRKEKRSKPMQKESKTKQKLEDRRSIRKASLLPVSKANHQLIETRKSEIDRIVLEDLVHFKEEHSEESASSYYSNESYENKETEEEKGILEPSLINSSFKRIRMKADRNWLFSCLDTLWFNGTYGAREVRLLIVNYIRNNQNMFENHVDGDFNDY